jgi:hypothetical protein
VIWLALFAVSLVLVFVLTDRVVRHVEQQARAIRER